MSSKNIQYIVLLLAIVGYVFFEQELVNKSLPEEKVTINVPEGFVIVTKVVDGDTIKIDRAGSAETVRLLGVNTPETVDPRKEVECFGKEASTYLSDLLVDSFVRLETDETQDQKDRYGRTLAYVFTEDGVLVNQMLIEEGFAFEYTYDTPYRYQSEFKKAEYRARTSGRGLWAKDTCNHAGVL